MPEHREMQSVRKGPFLGHSSHLLNEGAAVWSYAIMHGTRWHASQKKYIWRIVIVGNTFYCLLGSGWITR